MSDSSEFYDAEKNYLGVGRNKIPADSSFEEWIEFGMSQGWCGPPVCSTHDGVPMSEEEETEWETGSDPCSHVIRLYDDAAQKASIEKTHSPTNWRNTYTK